MKLHVYVVQGPVIFVSIACQFPCQLPVQYCQCPYIFCQCPGRMPRNMCCRTYENAYGRPLESPTKFPLYNIRRGEGSGGRGGRAWLSRILPTPLPPRVPCPGPAGVHVTATMRLRMARNFSTGDEANPRIRIRHSCSEAILAQALCLVRTQVRETRRQPRRQAKRQGCCSPRRAEVQREEGHGSIQGRPLPGWANVRKNSPPSESDRGRFSPNV